MWKTIPRPIRRWLWLAVLIPAAFWGLAKVGDEVAKRRGESTTTKALRAPRRVWSGRRTKAA